MPLDLSNLPAATRQQMLDGGLITPENELTGLGTLSANLSETALDESQRLAAVQDFNKGFLNPDLSFTRTGRLQYMDKETAVHEGRDTFRAWYKQGGFERHRADFPNDPLHKAVGNAVKHLATKTLPEAAKGAALTASSSFGIPKFVEWMSRQPWAPIVPGPMGKAAQHMQLMRKSGVPLPTGQEMQDAIDDLAAGTYGGYIREAGRNAALMSLGNNLIWAKAHAAASGNDEAEIQALYDFEKGMAEFNQTSAADAVSALAAFGVAVEPDDEKAQAAMIGAGQRARAAVEFARENVGDEELLEEAERWQASFGEIAGPDTVAGSLASLFPRKALMLGGRATLGRLTRLSDEIAEKTALRDTAEKALKDANAQELLGRTGVDRTALQRSAKELTEEIDELTATSEKIIHKSFAGGKAGAVRDSVRSFGNATTTWLSGSKLGTVGRGIDNYFTAPRGLPGHARNLAVAGGVVGGAMHAEGLLEKAGVQGGLGGAARWVTRGIALAALAPNIYRTARTLARTTHAMGAEFVARRSTQPYWQRVGRRMSDNKLIQGASVGMDLFARPMVPVVNVGKAAARATAAEMPFSFIASGGQEGWFAEAIAEGLVFGVPGQVQGLVHGMGGMPAVMKKDYFDQLATNDAAELRRYLPKRHQEAFDQLNPSVRRIVGVYSAMFPDLEFRFQAAPGGSTGSGYDHYHDTVYIDPNSKRPFDALIAHEIAHGVNDRGFDNLIIEELVGPEGLLRDENGNLTTDAQKFKAQYEADLGRPIDDETLAREWFAESAAPGLMQTQALQKLVRRNPWARSFAEAILPKIPFGKRLLLRSGILLDKNGKPVKGQGSMGAVVQGSPAMAGIIDRYLRAAAGQERSPDVTEKVIKRSADQPLTREEREYAERRNKLDFELNDDGSQKKVNGRRVRVSSKDLRLRRITVGEEIEALAEEISAFDPVRMPEKMSLVDKIDRFNEEDWIKLLDRLEKAGIYNPSQLAMFRDIFKRRAQGEKGAQMFDYQPALKTTAGGRRKKYEPRAAERIIGAVYEVKVTKDKNVILNIIDMDFLEQRAMKAAQTKLGQQLYPGGTADIMRDVMQLAENHVDGKLNAPIFTKPNQLNFLNGVLGNLSKEHKSHNPLASGRPAVRSLRLDRINRAEATAAKGLPFIPESWKQNLMPEPVDATTPQRDAPRQDTINRLPEADPGTGAQEGGLPTSGRRGVGGDQGWVPTQDSPYPPATRPPLDGLPQNVKVDGKPVIFGPFQPARQAAEDYMAGAGLEYVPPTTYEKVDRERATRIADEYERMPHAPNDPEVREAYRAMIDETLAQYEAIKATGLVVEPNPPNTDPYGNPRNAILDVVENNHMWFFPTNEGFGGDAVSDVDVAENPLLEETGEVINGYRMTANDVFRVVHDYFGHVKEGNGFRAGGEENAWRAHSAMYSPKARRAMTSETRGQNSWVNYGPHGEFNRTASGADTEYAAQKTGLLPEWVAEEGAGDDIRRMPEGAGAAAFRELGQEHPLLAGQTLFVFTPEKFTQVEFKDFDGRVHISSMFTPPDVRGEGLANKTMQDITDFADETGTTLSLGAKAFGNPPGLSSKQLGKWYERHGFVPGPGDRMVREPRPSDIRRMPEGDPQVNTPEFQRFFEGSKVTDANGAPLVVYHGSKDANVTEFDPKKHSHPNSIDSIGTWFTSAENQAPRYAFNATVYPVYLGIKNPWTIKAPPDLLELIGEPGKILKRIEGQMAKLKALHRTWERTLEEGEVTDLDRQNFKADQKFHKDQIKELQEELPRAEKAAKEAEPFQVMFNEWKKVHGGERFGDPAKFVEHLRSKGYDGIALKDTRADRGLQGDQVADWYIAFDSNQIKSATQNRGTFDPGDPDIRRMPEGSDSWLKAREKDFDVLATGQRGKPEAAMMKLTMYAGGGVYSFIAEHIGDLTHRMSESFSSFQGQETLVRDKVEKTLRTLRNDYGFEKEMRENETNNAKGRNRSLKEHSQTIREFSQQYADEHKKLPTFNKLQRAAKDAAVALGEFRFKDVVSNLEILEKALADGTYAEQAGQYFSDTVLRSDPKSDDIRRMPEQSPFYKEASKTLPPYNPEIEGATFRQQDMFAGLRALIGPNYSFVGGGRSGSSQAGEHRGGYDVYLDDRKGTDPNKFQKVGRVELFESDDKDRSLLRLVVIEVDKKVRRQGHAEGILRDLLPNIKDDVLELRDIQNKKAILPLLKKFKGSSTSTNQPTLSGFIPKEGNVKPLASDPDIRRMPEGDPQVQQTPMGLKIELTSEIGPIDTGVYKEGGKEVDRIAHYSYNWKTRQGTVQINPEEWKKAPDGWGTHADPGKLFIIAHEEGHHIHNDYLNAEEKSLLEGYWNELDPRARNVISALHPSSRPWTEWIPYHYEHLQKSKDTGSPYIPDDPRMVELVEKAIQREAQTAPDIRRMPGPADADHRAAVETGDTETAQRMFDEAARAAGYDTSVPLYRGFVKRPDPEGFVTRENRATVSLTPVEEVAKLYTHSPEFIGIKQGKGATLHKYYTRFKNPLNLEQLEPRSELDDILDQSGASWTFYPLELMEEQPKRFATSKPLFTVEELRDMLEEISESSQSYLKAEVTGGWGMLGWDNLDDVIDHIDKQEWDRETDPDGDHYSEAIGYAVGAVKADVFAVADTHTFTEYVRRLGHDAIIHPDTIEAGAEYFGKETVAGRPIEEVEGIDVEDDYRTTTIRPFEMHQMKLADPATYDNQGNLIPLSERFDPESDDIRRLPEAKATIEQFKGQNIQVLTSDMSIVKDIARGNDVVAMKGGPAFLDNRGWAFTTKGAAEAFRERWKKSGQPLIGLTTLTPNNHLNSSDARLAYALKWRDAVAAGTISKTAANKHVRQAMLRIIRSDAKSSLVKTAKPTAKKIKTVDDLVEHFPQLPWGSSSVFYQKLAGRTLPIKPAKLKEAGLDIETIADELRQPEFQGAGLGDLFAVAKYDGSAPRHRPKLNKAYPWFIAMPKRAVLKEMVSVADLTTDARVFQKKDPASGQLSAQPLMTTGVMLDNVTKGLFPAAEGRKRIQMDPETPVTPSDPAEQIIERNRPGRVQSFVGRNPELAPR